ncbi:MAG TPA: methyltransferase domain-containing protein [Puia sp.]|jgi:SAM-dependent methyltransferase|nr:methyltransferase domain-containing protein [Puia sp.]
MTRRLQLPLHRDRPKNWDSLAAYIIIQRYCGDKSANILDAGGEVYSAILPQLESAGYKNLRCNNLVFKKGIVRRKGSILYEYGDITGTSYANGCYDAITCLSVIEHGVNIAAFFKEMSRILKPGGVLFVSTDYWYDPINTEGKFAYGVPIRIFSAKQIANVVQVATIHGFKLAGPLDLTCADRVVEWKEAQLNFTFIYFTLIKVR